MNIQYVIKIEKEYPVADFHMNSHMQWTARCFSILFTVAKENIWTVKLWQAIHFKMHYKSNFKAIKIWQKHVLEHWKM